MGVLERLEAGNVSEQSENSIQALKRVENS